MGVMVAAVYCRKSTDQSAVADEAKSVTRQLVHAKAYAVRKGWRVSDAHVYTDEAQPNSFGINAFALQARYSDQGLTDESGAPSNCSSTSAAIVE